MNTEVTRQILLVDDHEMIRRGLRALIETQPGWEVCGEATDGRMAVEMATELAPDVVVMDLSMPLLNGLEAARQMAEKVRRSKVIILSMHQAEEFVREAVDAGVHGYVLKSDAGRDLIAAIETVLQGKPFFTAQVVASIHRVAVAPRPGRIGPGKPLTAREREIVQLLAEGKINREVGKLLGISVKTVETHRARVMRKLGVKTVADLVRYAIRNGVVSA